MGAICLQGIISKLYSQTTCFSYIYIQCMKQYLLIVFALNSQGHHRCVRMISTISITNGFLLLCDTCICKMGVVAYDAVRDILRNRDVLDGRVTNLHNFPHDP